MRTSTPLKMILFNQSCIILNSRGRRCCILLKHKTWVENCWFSLATYCFDKQKRLNRQKKLKVNNKWYWMESSESLHHCCSEMLYLVTLVTEVQKGCWTLYTRWTHECRCRWLNWATVSGCRTRTWTVAPETAGRSWWRPRRRCSCSLWRRVNMTTGSRSCVRSRFLYVTCIRHGNISQHHKATVRSSQHTFRRVQVVKKQHLSPCILLPG